MVKGKLNEWNQGMKGNCENEVFTTQFTPFHSLASKSRLAKPKLLVQSNKLEEWPAIQTGFQVYCMLLSGSNCNIPN